MTVEWCLEHERHERIPACSTMDIPDDDLYSEPCQPIGCDNGYHLAGCMFDQSEV